MNSLGPLMQVGGTIKVSLTTPNIANVIAEHLSIKWPELTGYCFNHDGIWWTGSQVWSWLYNTRPPGTSDTDIVCIGTKVYTGDEIQEDFIAKTSLHSYAQTVKGNPYTSATGYKPGLKIHHPQCEIDIWSSDNSIQDSLLVYPEDSHAHCRVAYSFTKGLVILPNSKGW